MSPIVPYYVSVSEIDSTDFGDHIDPADYMEVMSDNRLPELFYKNACN